METAVDEGGHRCIARHESSSLTHTVGLLAHSGKQGEFLTNFFKAFLLKEFVAHEYNMQ